MSEWISPIDRHRHFGDAGRASCAVCCLEAERDQFRDHAIPEAARIMNELTAERNRLQKVVDALREHRALNGRFWQPDISDDEAVEAAEQEAQAWQAVVVALDQLDATPTGEGKVAWLEARVRQLEAGIMAAEVHGELIVRMHESVWREFEADRDRLRDELAAIRPQYEDHIRTLNAQLAEELCNGQSTEGAYHDATDERDRLRKVIEHVIETLSESASSAPGVLATVGLMRLALDPTGEGT